VQPQQKCFSHDLQLEDLESGIEKGKVCDRYDCYRFKIRSRINSSPRLIPHSEIANFDIKKHLYRWESSTEQGSLIYPDSSLTLAEAMRRDIWHF
jgi:hypothetical protein